LKYMRNTYLPLLESWGRMALWSKGYISEASNYRGPYQQPLEACGISLTHRVFCRGEVARRGAQAGYYRAVGGQVLCQVRLGLGYHELLQIPFRASILATHELGRTPPAGKDGFLLGGERERRGVA
jgi:hypothetical protein